MRKMWERSALVAWDSRPRDVREELRVGNLAKSELEEQHGLSARWKGHAKERTVIAPDIAKQAWGYISHPGWSSPASDQLPNLEYWRVFVELPNLIEAKAVSLAPPGSVYLKDKLHGGDSPPVPDARVVAMLQRPATQGLREYFDHLTQFGVIGPPGLAEDFLAQYELARFSSGALTEKQFAELTSSFSALLTSMTGLDPAAVDPEFADSSSISSRTSYTGSDSLARSKQSTVRSRLSGRSSRNTPFRSNSTGTVFTAPSRHRTPIGIHQVSSDESLASGTGSARRLEVN